MAKRYVVAVSGGVDSVVLLDILYHKYLYLGVKPLKKTLKKPVVLLDVMANGNHAQYGLQGEERSLELTSKDLAEGQAPPYELIVAHFDHGIRTESADDALFVKSLAEKYHITFETTREELGKNASEELARERRYAFLRSVAKKHDATIVTAHHADDIVETIAINLIRGSGWRGLAVLDSPDIVRPLLNQTKSELIAYAKKNQLPWREDVTNQDTKYLRNDVRQKLADLDSQTKELLRLYRNRQIALKHIIDTVASMAQASPYSRYLLTNVPQVAALEILRVILIQETGQSVTRPQLDRALLAVKTYRVGKTAKVGDGIELSFTRTHFTINK